MKHTEKTKNTRRNGIAIMSRLIGLVKPLLPVMLLAIVLGTIGYLCAIFLTILAGYGLLHILLGPVLEPSGVNMGSLHAGILQKTDLKALLILLPVMAVLRGFAPFVFRKQRCG